MEQASACTVPGVNYPGNWSYQDRGSPGTEAACLRSQLFLLVPRRIFFSLLRGAIYLFLLAHGPSLNKRERKAIIHYVTVPLVIGLVSAWETGPEKAGAAVRNGSSTPQKRGADSNQRTRGKKGPRIDVSAYPDWRHLITLFFFLSLNLPSLGDPSHFLSFVSFFSQLDFIHFYFICIF